MVVPDIKDIDSFVNVSSSHRLSFTRDLSHFHMRSLAFSHSLSLSFSHEISPIFTVALSLSLSFSHVNFHLDEASGNSLMREFSLALSLSFSHVNFHLDKARHFLLAIFT